MFTIGEVYNVNVWSVMSSWKSTPCSEHGLAGTLGGISGVSQPPSILDPSDGTEDVTSVSVAVKAELKVDLMIVRDHSNSEAITEFL